MEEVKFKLKSYEDTATDMVANILSEAKFRAEKQLSLNSLASSRDEFRKKTKVPLQALRSPLVVNCEKLILDTIQEKWDLAKTFKYHMRFMGSSTDESAHYLYYEVVFSQPTVAYPVPQATVSVYFRVENKLLEPAGFKGGPNMTFRIEGHYTDYDVREVLLSADWILAVIKMKITVLRRIVALKSF